MIYVFKKKIEYKIIINLISLFERTIGYIISDGNLKRAQRASIDFKWTVK